MFSVVCLHLKRKYELGVIILLSHMQIKRQIWRDISVQRYFQKQRTNNGKRISGTERRRLAWRLCVAMSAVLAEVDLQCGGIFPSGIKLCSQVIFLVVA